MAGKLRNCPICSNAYIDTGGGACSNCVGQLQAMKDKVMEYVNGHPNAQIADIVNGTGISEESIKRLFTDGEITYPCSRCGAPILEGKYCKPCLEFLRKSLDKATVRNKKKEEVKSKKKASRMSLGWD